MWGCTRRTRWCFTPSRGGCWRRGQGGSARRPRPGGPHGWGGARRRRRWGGRGRRGGWAVKGYEGCGVGVWGAVMLYSLLFYPWKVLWPGDRSGMYELPARVEPRAWGFLRPMVAVQVITGVLIALRRRWPGGLAAWV